MRRARFSPSSRPTRLTAALAGAAAAGVMLTSPGAVAATDPHPRAVAAATWLKSQLDDQLPFEQYGSASWGPTLDAFYAFDELGVRQGQQDLLLMTLESDVESYVAFGGEDIAGAIAKTLSAVQGEGIAESTYADGDLLDRLEAQVEPSGADEGRVHEYYDNGTTVTDYSNTLDQAWAVRALAGADSTHEDRALEFLLRQQCEDGWFRESMASSDPCTSSPSVDTTALAVLSITSAVESGVDVDPATVAGALDSAGRWLAAIQRRNGGYEGVSGVSSDSTGLAARALLALGRVGRADDAAEWVQARQVTTAMVRRTALRRADLGAIAPTSAALDRAKRRGIESGVRINWRLATAQAAPALDALIPG